VARLAGVDRSTVSLVLNDPQTRRITAATKQRVLDAAASIGYAPNAAASQLRAGTSRIILMPILPLPFGPAYDRLLEGIGDGADAHGRYLLIHGARRLTRVAAARAWAQLRPEIVIAESGQLGREGVEILLTAGAKVIIGMGDVELPGVHPVDFDHHRAGSLAARYLLSETVDELVAIMPSDPRHAEVAKRRLEGFTAAARHLSVNVAPREAQGAALIDWLTSVSEAAGRVGVFACTEGLADSVFLAARAAGIPMPERMAVVAVEGSPSGDRAARPYARVSWDAALLGRQVVAAAVDMVIGRHATMPTVEYTLIPAAYAGQRSPATVGSLQTQSDPRSASAGKKAVEAGRGARGSRGGGRGPRRAGGATTPAAPVAATESAPDVHGRQRSGYDAVADRVVKRRTAAARPRTKDDQT